ncbi:MAG: FMN-binding protein [Gammaproteobacteria bacterium]
MKKCLTTLHLVSGYLLIALFFSANVSLARGTYQTNDEFLAQSFEQSIPAPKMVWLTGDRKQTVKNILNHDYPNLRIRYWQNAAISAWILDEIGKEHPITVGIVVKDGAIQQIRVLAFRESRGDEIRHAFFTRQFEQLSLTDNDQLNQKIDGISGATLSVRAMQRLATLALFLDSETR